MNHTTDGQEDAKKRMTATNQWMHQPINPAHPRLTNAIDKSLKLENIMNEKMSKRRIQITDLQKQEIEEKEEEERKKERILNPYRNPSMIIEKMRLQKMYLVFGNMSN